MSVTLRRWSGRTSALQAARDLYAATNPKWYRDVELHHDKEAYETPWVLNLPAKKMVDRLGNAPSRGCLQDILELLLPALENW